MASLIPLIAEFVAGVVATAIATWIAEGLTEWFVYVMQAVIVEWVTAVLSNLVAFFATLLAPA
jgi:hypothetical protein